MSKINLPKLGRRLNKQQLELLKAISQSCRKSILQMVTNAQSGHPGGSLGSIDYLSLIYAFIINQSNEPVIVSNGHISPAVYSILGELGATNKAAAIKNFRKANDVYEGHVTREVNGVWYGTGPLGIGSSVAAGIAHSYKLKQSNQKVFLLMGDGENQEGQCYEMMHYASKYQLNNLILFIDYNQVQLTDAINKIMPLNLKKQYEAAGWTVIETDGHNYQKLWKAISKATKSNKPTCILGNTIMGYGVPLMEASGRKHQSTWHGQAPDPKTGQELVEQLTLNLQQQTLISKFNKQYPTKIKTLLPNNFENKKIKPIKLQTYSADTLTDCRSAYGQTLLKLAQKNKHILALSADLSGSDRTKYVKEKLPNQHLEVGIAEQHLVSCSGGLSLNGYIPFCSTFGAFMTSRAKDQARVNDINHTNVKMVATHCGLSVGEDGPTHQSVDDLNSFLGFFNTQIFEPADPNQTIHIINHIAGIKGNCYVRMGRSKTPIITKENGTPFYDDQYNFKPGKADLIRKGKKLTIIASGPIIANALQILPTLPANTVELIAVSSFNPFDQKTIIESIKKTKKVIIASDHQINTGLTSLVKNVIAENQLKAEILNLGVNKYQLSGTADQLYKKTRLDSQSILASCKKLLNQNG